MHALIIALFLIAAPARAADSLNDGWDAYESGNFTTARLIFQRLAHEGDESAQFNLGRLYDTGRGVAADAAEALHWYRLAAEQGHRAAQFLVGLKYQRGEGVAADVVEAARWYRLSAKQGYPGAQLNLGALYALGEGVAKDPVRALAWWILASEQGNTLAASNRKAMAERLESDQLAEAERLAQTLAPE